MPSAAEGFGQQSQQQAVLDAGIELISAHEQVQFVQYQKWQFAVDGSVFWVKTNNAPLTATGALHYATDRIVDEDQTLGANQVILNSEVEITQFNNVNPQTMWIGSWPISGSGETLQVAFAQRGNYFQEADIWHYNGFAVYPALKTQIIASAADLPAGPIVSNSLPIWLSQTVYNGLTVSVYPSFLVPDNISPPYVVAHVEPSGTITLGAFPVIGPWPGQTISGSGSDPLHALASSQLCRDRVILTLYGFNNQMAISYLQQLIETSTDFELFGFANSPSIQDAKRVQVEIAALAQKKTIEILANYYQGTSDAVARRLLLSPSVSNFYILGGASNFGQAAITQAESTVAGTGTG
jgi:hypothetical protein